MGGYDVDPEDSFTNIFDYAKGGLLRFVRVCCETFPSHDEGSCLEHMFDDYGENRDEYYATCACEG